MLHGVAQLNVGSLPAQQGVPEAGGVTATHVAAHRGRQVHLSKKEKTECHTNLGTNRIPYWDTPLTLKSDKTITSGETRHSGSNKIEHTDRVTEPHPKRCRAEALTTKKSSRGSVETPDAPRNMPKPALVEMKDEPQALQDETGLLMRQVERKRERVCFTGDTGHPKVGVCLRSANH